MRPIALFVPLALLSLWGFGCKEPGYNQHPAANWRGVIQDTTPKPNTRPPASRPPTANKRLYDNERPLPPEVPILRQALRNLAGARSFRASLTLPPAEGQSQPTKGEVSFHRDHGLRGSIVVTPDITSQLLIKDNRVYFRANTSTWQNITNTAEADRLQQFFLVAFPSEVRTNQVLVSDSARILEVTDDPAGCKRYTFDEVMPNGEREQTILCIKNNLPTYIINQYVEGSTEVRYSNINEDVAIGGINDER